MTDHIHTYLVSVIYVCKTKWILPCVFISRYKNTFDFFWNRAKKATDWANVCLPSVQDSVMGVRHTNLKTADFKAKHVDGKLWFFLLSWLDSCWSESSMCWHRTSRFLERFKDSGMAAMNTQWILSHTVNVCV